MKDLKQFLNEKTEDRMSPEVLTSTYNDLDKKDEIIITYNSVSNGLTRANFIVTKGATKVGPSKVERISLASKNNPKGIKYYLYNRGGISFAMGDMGATLLKIEKV